jgi:hypothetical protein
MNVNRLRNRFWRRFYALTGRKYDNARLRGLPRTIEYTGEFGLELLIFLPFVNWLSQAGLLRGRTIKTYRGMSSFYKNIECKTYIEKNAAREFVSPGNRPAYLPVKNEHDFDGVGRSPFHAYPDFRRIFRALPLPKDFETRLIDKPLLIIHNKYTDEWDSGPINHISLHCLERIFTEFKNVFTIVYIRHGIRTLSHGYVIDENTIMQFDDATLLEEHPEVILFDDLFDNYQSETGAADVNAFKNALCSRSYRIITSQGGGAHHLAYFSGSVMAILHRQGLEEELAYGDGFYDYLANPSPIRLCCRTEDELLEACGLFHGSEVVDGRILLRTNGASTVAHYSPGAFAARADRPARG